MKQPDLFSAPTPLPAGFEYRAEFLSRAEESELLQVIQALPLKEAQYKEFQAKRRIVSYGGRYDFSQHELLPAGPIPEFLHPLRERAAEWAGVPAIQINHALIAEYRPGTQLGWHRDVPDFDVVIGVSLAGSCRMRFRPYPPPQNKRKSTLVMNIEPRSIYRMKEAARWEWQHSVAPTKELRYSITFRTLNT
jgi:alkylated DNA repair dioxygenase AlkB